jgi:putative membrane protein
MRFLVKLIINALALWLTTFVVAGITVEPYAHTQLATIVTYLLVALVFGIVNGVVGTVVRVVAFPLYILTLGLLALIVNALLLMLSGWVTGLFGFGLHVAGFWSGFWGAIVLSIISWLMGLLLRPLVRR